MGDVLFQTEVEKLHHESMHFPATLYGRADIERLQIVGDVNAIGDLLSHLTLPDGEWIVFGSKDVLEDAQPRVTELALDRDQKRRFEWLSMFHGALYGAFADLSRARELMTSSLWDLAGGIALPIPDRGEESVTEALEIQLALGDRLAQAVDGPQGVFVLGCTDAWGVDCVWSKSAAVGPHFGRVARRLVA